MPIFKTKYYDRPFAQIDKRILADKRLSWKSRGILCYLLSHPPDWKIKSFDIVNQGKDEGIDSVRASIRELIAAGYLVYLGKERLSNGTFGEAQYEVYEVPISTEPEMILPFNQNMSALDDDYPDMAKPGLDEPSLDEPDLANPSVNNNDLNNIKHSELSKAEQYKEQTRQSIQKFYLKHNDQGEIFEWLDEGLVHLATAFLVAAGDVYRPGIHERSLWRKEVRNWQSIGITPDIIRATVNKMLTDGLTIAGPQSITNIARSILAKSDKGMTDMPPIYRANQS